MAPKARSAPDLLLLLSLFSVILLNQILDQGDLRRLILAGSVPVIIAMPSLAACGLPVPPKRIDLEDSILHERSL